MIIHDDFHHVCHQIIISRSPAKDRNEEIMLQLRQSQKEALKFLRPFCLSASPQENLHVTEPKNIN